jgi:hypothetical protein
VSTPGASPSASGATPGAAPPPRPFTGVTWQMAHASGAAARFAGFAEPCMDVTLFLRETPGSRESTS